MGKRSAHQVSRLCALCIAAAIIMLAPAPAKADPLLLNFRDVDIRQIIETVGELTGRNFLIDPRVKARVTILANTEVPEEALYDVLLSILSMHGFRAVDGLGLTRIVPVNLGARFPPSEIPEALITEIIATRNLSAPTVVPIIKPLMTQQAQLAVHKESNLMIVTETQANIERIKTIIGKIDHQSLLGHEIIALRHILSKDAVRIVTRAVPKNVRGLVEVIADNEGNRLILTGSPDVRLSIRALLAELDTPVPITRVEGELEVIALRYAKAEDVETILSGLLNSRFLETAAPLDSKKPQTAKKPAKKAAAKKGSTVVKKKDRNVGKKYVVQADPATNSIIIGGTAEILEILRGLIHRLDVPRPQVLIEAIIADVSDNKIEALGAEIRLGSQARVGGEAAFNFPADYSGLLGIFSQGTLRFGAQAVSQTAGGVAVPFNILINAIRQSNDSEILSTPSILTLNNESAVIDVSDERSVLTGAISDTDSTRLRQSFERIKFGTRLEVLPQITEGDAVRLEIRQVVEDIDNATTEDQARPNTRSREIETTVVVNDGDILVLGGLARKNRALTDNKVPFLNSLPIVGPLFRNRNDSALRTNLVLFIRPTILRTAEDSAAISEEKYAAVRMRQLLQLRDTADRGLLTPKDDIDILLPKIGEPDAKRRTKKTAKPRRSRDSTLRSEPRRKKDKRRVKQRRSKHVDV